MNSILLSFVCSVTKVKNCPGFMSYERSLEAEDIK